MVHHSMISLSCPDPFPPKQSILSDFSSKGFGDTIDLVDLLQPRPLLRLVLEDSALLNALRSLSRLCSSLLFSFCSAVSNSKATVLDVALLGAILSKFWQNAVQKYNEF